MLHRQTYLVGGVSLWAASARAWEDQPYRGLLWGQAASVWREWAMQVASRGMEEYERGVEWQLRRGIRGIWEETVGGGRVEWRRRGANGVER